MRQTILTLALAAALMSSATTARADIDERGFRRLVTITTAYTIVGTAGAVALTILVHPLVGVASGALVALPFEITIGTEQTRHTKEVSSKLAKYRAQLLKEDAAAYLANREAGYEDAPSAVLEELFAKIRVDYPTVSDEDLARALVVAQTK